MVYRVSVKSREVVLAEHQTQTSGVISGGTGHSRRQDSTTAASGFYTGVSSPSFLSSFLSALCAVDHIHAGAVAASNTAASAVRIFHLGLSLQRLAKYNATANALANATATLPRDAGPAA